MQTVLAFFGSGISHHEALLFPLVQRPGAEAVSIYDEAPESPPLSKYASSAIENLRKAITDGNYLKFHFNTLRLKNHPVPSSVLADILSQTIEEWGHSTALRHFIIEKRITRKVYNLAINRLVPPLQVPPPITQLRRHQYTIRVLEMLTEDEACWNDFKFAEALYDAAELSMESKINKLAQDEVLNRDDPTLKLMCKVARKRRNLPILAPKRLSASGAGAGLLLAEKEHSLLLSLD